MFRRHVREKAPHHRAQAARDPLHKTGPFRQAHHPQPERHHADQPERDGHSRLRSVERARGHLGETIVPPANGDRQKDER